MARLLNIQILRAVAALFVVVFHCGLEMTRIADGLHQAPFFDHARWNVGVSLFFAISGFIMIVTCHDAFGNPGTSLRFMRRRLVRIVPIYWVLTAAIIAFSFALPQLGRVASDDPVSILLSFWFWPFARPDGEVRPLVTPGWTLNLEVYFYVVFAIGLAFRRRLGLAIIILGIGGLSLLRMAGLFESTPLRFWGDPIVLGFLFGMAVGLAAKQGWRLPPAIAVLLMAGGFALSLSGGIRSLPEDALLARLSNSLPALLILIGAALGPQVRRNWHGWRPLILIGDASYSLYLVHEFLLRPLRLGWERFVGDALPLFVFLALGISLSIVAGLLSYHLLEQPMDRWLKARLAKRPPMAGAAPVEA